MLLPESRELAGAAFFITIFTQFLAIGAARHFAEGSRRANTPIISTGCRITAKIRAFIITKEVSLK